MGSVLSVIAYVIVAKYEQSNAASQFEKIAYERVVSLEEHVGVNLIELNSIASFFQSSKEVTGTAFKTFVTPVMEATQNINVIQWLPYVAAGSRKQKYSVLFAVSRKGYQGHAEKAFANGPALIDLLAKAKESGETFVSSILDLGAVDAGRSVVFVKPVYNTAALGKGNQVEQDVRGYILSYVSVREMVEGLFSERLHTQYMQQDVDIYLYDVKASADKSLLYLHQSPLRQQYQAPVLSRSQALMGVHESYEFIVGGKTWQVVARPTQGSLVQGFNWIAALALMIGFLLTASLIAYLRMSIREKGSIEQLAKQRASNELDRFKYVLDNTLDMIFMFDQEDLHFIYMNRGAVESMGYTQEELLQMTPYDIKPMYEETEFREMIQPLLAAKEDVLHFETVHRRKDGVDFPVEIFLQLVREPNGGGRFIAIVRDISERKQAEQQEKRYAMALEDLHDITSQPGMVFEERIHALLELGRKFFGLPIAIMSRIDGQRYTVEHVVGSILKIEPGSEYDLQETYCSEASKTLQPVGYHHVGKSLNSQHPCYKSSALEAYIGTPLMIEGELYGTLNFSGPDALEKPFNKGDFSLLRIFAQWVGNEITRIKIDNDLQDNAARLATILDTVVDAIITINEVGNIDSLNTAGSELFGYSAEELIGMPFKDLLPEKEAYEYQQYLQKYLTTGEATLMGRRVEANGMRKDGSYVPIEFAVNEMILGGRRYFTAVVRDISERKKVDRMKSEFVSTVSHELRTPLTSIRGALSLVLGKTAGELPRKVRHMLEMANRNSERLTFLINDILDLEKIDAGHLEFEMHSIDLVELIKRAIEDNDSFAHSHKVTLSFAGASVDEALVYADEHRLSQVLANLISNAVKYSNEGSVVMIELKKNADKFRVSISDTGAGIPEEFRSRIFARFAQADSSDTRDKGGTGLGLAITKAIIDQHAGHIDYRSEVGQGTEFFFDLPEWKSVRLAANENASLPRVLICEDNSDVAEILVNLLDQDGFRSDIAATLNDARDLLAAHDYQLLLLDLTLPDGDGLQLIQDIRSTEGTELLPVIVVSARADDARQELVGDAFTMIDWIQKPIERGRLSMALQQVLANNKQPRVLHVEDDLDVVQITRALLEEVGDIDYVTSLEQARARLKAGAYDLLILDLSLPDGSGLDLLDELKACCPVVIFSGLEPDKKIIEQVEAALTKSRTNGELLLKTVRRVLQQSYREKNYG